MNYQEAEEYSLKVKWKTSFCNEGESCWCRLVEPEEPVIDDKGNEIFIAAYGDLSKIHAEYIVKLHNNSLV